MAKTAQTYEVYSRTGKLLDVLDELVKAERRLGEWFNAAYVVLVDAKGKRSVFKERKELRP